MKKLTTIVSSYFLLLLLAACNGTTETVDQVENNEKPTSETENIPESLTLEEVFEKSVQASQDLKSFAMDMDLVQEITSDQEQENMKIHSSIFMEVVSEPITFYQKMQMEIPELTEPIETESYFSQEGFYMHDPTSGTWMKFPTEMTDQLLQLSAQQTNPGEEIQRLKSFSDDFTFEEKEDGYHLTLHASGDEFNAFIQETLEQTLPAEMIANNETMQDLTINQVVYDILIDQDTFFPKTIDVSMDMEMVVENQTIQLKQQMSGQYSEYNNIKEITIPQEVIDTAEEIAL